MQGVDAPLAGNGIESCVDSDGATCSAFASVTIRDRRSIARCPDSRPDRCDGLKPARPAITARDFPRER